MPLLDHLIELRNRLMWSLGALILAFLLCFAVADHIYQFLMHPLVQGLGAKAHERRMIFTAPQEFFLTQVKVAFWAGAMVAFPIIASQIYKFVAPGLYKHERSAFLPFLVATPVLFLLGAALVSTIAFLLTQPASFWPWIFLPAMKPLTDAARTLRESYDGEVLTGALKKTAISAFLFSLLLSIGLALS